MNINDKVILTDCDGCLTDWFFGFRQWMQRHGFVEKGNVYDMYRAELLYDVSENEIDRYVGMFNESASIAYLSPYVDAIKYVKKLHEEHGFVFHCITKLGTDQHVAKLREQNLTKLFGETAFEKITCMGRNESKYNYLKPYENSGCVWIEDSYTNYKMGEELGLNSFLMDNPHNSNKGDESTQRVYRWKEIYDCIVS